MQKAPPHALGGVNVTGSAAAAALIADATPKILAELHIIDKLAESLASDEGWVSSLDITPVSSHFSALRCELKELINHDAALVKLFEPFLAGLDTLIQSASLYEQRGRGWEVSDVRLFCADGRSESPV